MLLLLRFLWALRCLLSPFGLKFASGEPHRVTEITVAPDPALEPGPTASDSKELVRTYGASAQLRSMPQWLWYCDLSQLTAGEVRSLPAEHAPPR